MAPGPLFLLAPWPGGASTDAVQPVRTVAAKTSLQLFMTFTFWRWFVDLVRVDPGGVEVQSCPPHADWDCSLCPDRVRYPSIFRLAGEIFLT
jgi:hypothetical protein